MAALIAYNTTSGKWPARPSTTAKTTPVVWVGPSTAPNPPQFIDGVDHRLTSGTPQPSFSGY